MEPGRESLFLEDFGQKVDLTRRIREVLLNYPEGTTVLKELIQNADDAGAKCVRFCLDRRVHGSQSLLSDSLAQWQGPALLAFNDAVFTEEDFVSISRIGGSGKHGQAWKTGRFGVGFNSVYHLTDLPSFVSDKYVVIFDPQGVYLPNISTANPGKRIEYVSSSAISVYKDQLVPYCAFGCDMESPFAGTLFRFPLRNAEQAARSKLSRQAYTEDDINSMFVQVYEEGVFSLLFLKSVLSVEMYVWDSEEAGPRKLYSCSVYSPNDDILWHRQALLRLSKSVISSESEMDAYLVNFLSEDTTGNQATERIDTFYVVQMMASMSSRIGSFAATASRDYDMHLLPWASAAACLSDNSDEGVLKVGRAFCSLPLPVRTGLTVQLNGYFEVSSNRRGIWYGADMDRSGRIRSIWNRLLLEDVLCPAFTQLLLGVQDSVDPTNSYYSLWPKGSFEEPWNIFVESVYRNISNFRVLYSDLEERKWVTPVDAYFHDEEFRESKELGEALLQLGMPIVHLLSDLVDMFLKYASGFQQKVVTPDIVRSFLRTCKTLSLSKSLKLVILEYCIEDLVDDDVGAYASNLALLPLANGDFGMFCEAKKGVSYYVCNELEYKLLEEISDRIIDQSIPLNILSRLTAIAMTSKANLAVFSVHHFVKLFPKFVPADWKLKTEVLWEPESGTHPSKSWFVLFWQYLQHKCERLSLFGDWPVLPSTSGHLYRPSTQSKLINAEKLSATMREILLKIGCKILDPYYGVNHADLSNYVSDANFPGVLEAVFDVVSSNGSIMQIFSHILTSEDKDELRKFLLDPKWYIGYTIDGSNIKNCMRLPIYKVYSRESGQDSCFSDLGSPQKYLPPLGIPTYLLGGEFIFCTSNGEEEILLRYYEITRMGKARFYMEHVLNRFEELLPEFQESVMLSILENLPQLSLKDPSLRECLKNLEFVPTSCGSLKSSAVLYDPRNEELYALLDDSQSFPSGSFQEPAILDMLLGIGLRTSVTAETVIESARQVERLMHEDQEKAHSKGKVLLAYLEVNAMKWLPDQFGDYKGTVNRMFSTATTAFRARNLKSDLEKFWNGLRSICWCPVLVSAPLQGLPWPVVSSKVAPPKLVRLQADMWIVSACMRILDGECSSTALSYNLGWLSPPGGSAIAAQLLELGKNNEIMNDQVLRQDLALAMPRIYSILTSMIGSDEMDIVQAVLEGSRWVWVGDGFATSDEVVLDGPLHLAPYVRVVPTDLAVFKELFLELGIREFLKPSDYANILCKMAARKGSSPLDMQEIRAAILIVQHMAEAQFNEQVKIYLPDVSGRLFLASDLVYNDAPWLLGSDDPNTLFGNTSATPLNTKGIVHKFVHGNISNEVAEKLGVCSLRRILLAESADSMNISLSGAAEAFGQHEALTTRLRHILEMYADGPGILFEMVQNAEDAGASEVAFLLDKTQYGTSSVLSPEMADWQGAALYCFNDSVFSPQDLYAISRIGQESKLEKPFAIGRFGLGFNCVYHFTDVPTFVSGENIVMFDPHASNLPGISPSHPGLRIKFQGRKILEKFPDQFSPFLYFGCDLQQYFPGTLFRFPLRTASVASRSQIKKEGYAPEDVMSLFSSFSAAVSDALLFLRNVKAISIFVKEGSGSDMQLLHHVQKECISEPETKSDALHQIFSLIDAKQHSGMDKGQLLQKLSKSLNGDLPYKCQKILVTERSSSGGMSHCWITGECIGSGCPNNSAVSKDKFLKSIPWACVAAYIHSVKDAGEQTDILQRGNACSSDLFQLSMLSVQDRKDFEGRAFCFLPLPINTGLPAHVNAYFELSSNRRDIWFGNDMAGGGKKRSDWNIYLLEDVLAPAYGHLLQKIALEVGPSELYVSFWPKAIGLEPWASLVRKFYTFVSDSGLSILHTKARGGQWISTKQAIFPDFAFHKAHELLEGLCDAGLPVTSIPKLIVERFMEVCPSLHFLTPQLLRSLLIRRIRKFKDRNAMILSLEYCLLDLKIPIQLDCLCGLPLLPLADGLFTSFENHGAGERIYIAKGEEYGLLKDVIPQQLVDCELPEVVHIKLCDLAQSERSNIFFLSCHLLEKLFLKILPVEWQFAKKVSWSPCDPGQPSTEWIKLLWNYLRSCCDDLKLFSKWPILPVGDNILMQLVENSNVIRDDGWSENMSSLLLKVGCLFLNCDLQIEHPQLEHFVQPSSAMGILNAFLSVAGKAKKIESLFSEASEGELHELRSYVLQSKWFSEQMMDYLHIDLIKRIPMFESYRSRKLVGLNNPVKWIKPIGIREDLLDDSFVRVESERERVILYRYLEIREPSKVEFYKSYVLNRMSEFMEQPGDLLAILNDLKLLIEEDGSINAALSTTPFVHAANGSWQQPNRLYDPRVLELQKLLHKEVFFPSEKFSDPEILDTLVTLGLKRTLGFTGFLDCARSASVLNDSGDPRAQLYGRKLLVYLDAVACKLSADKDGNSDDSHNDLLRNTFNIADSSPTSAESVEGDHMSLDDSEVESVKGNLIVDMSEEEFWLEIKSISWCPVCANPPMQGLPWLKSTTLVASPSSVRPESQMWMVSSMMHILDGQCGSMYLQRQLGWLDLPNTHILSTQLIELSKSYGQLKLQSVVEPDFNAAIQQGIPILYSRMQEHIGTNDFMVLKLALDGVPWVWIGDDFITPNALAFDSPVKYTPYLYVVPSELSEFRDLLLELGVRTSFDIWDYFQVLQRLQNDVKGLPLLADQLGFVNCVLEAVADCCTDKPFFEAANTPLLVPDCFGVLRSVADLVYNDAPWIEENGALVSKHFVHPSISNELADRLGVKSLRCLSLVNEDMIKDLPCMDFARISELMSSYGSNDFLLFDLLELADCCKATKLHIIFDKREHPRQSLLQHNLAEFQGPALLAVLEGASLSREEISSLQLLPPWRLRGTTFNYGLGMLSGYFICDLLSMISGGHFYLFDPRGLALAVPSGHGPAAKTFSLSGTDLTERFSDQFTPLLIGQSMSWSSSDSTIIRMPLSSDCLKDGHQLGLKKIKQIEDRLVEHASSMLLFLKSILQVTFSTWEEGNPQLSLNYSVSVDSLCASMRNPFLEKKWRKFQLSRLFGSSNAASKLHVIDVNLFQRGSRFVDRWLVSLSLGSGQTRNMALDRRYIAYNLTPVAGVAAHISRNGHPVEANLRSSIMSPLPLSGGISLPVTVLGFFLVRHNGGRYLIKHQRQSNLGEEQPDAGDQLIEAWNRELLSCVRDSYIELVVEMLKLRREPSNSSIQSSASQSVAVSLKAYGDKIYLFWPSSTGHATRDTGNLSLTNVLEADWKCLIEQVIRPFYARMVDLPVWQLYSGNLVKAEDGMFLSQPGNGVGGNLLPATVCSFVKEHYQVFSVPWILVNEIHAVGFKVNEIKPKMVRDLLKVPSKSIVLQSVDTFVDVLEYCLSDIQFPESSNFHGDDTSENYRNPSTSETGTEAGSTSAVATAPNLPSNRGSSTQNTDSSGDALEMMTSLGRALFDFGRGVVEDIGRTGVVGERDNTLSNEDMEILSVASEIKRLPCPTATNKLARVGVAELWLGDKDQQNLMMPLAARFVHSKVLERSSLEDIFSKVAIQPLLKLKSFSFNLMAGRMRFLFNSTWVNHVMESNIAPWFSWDGGPSTEWLKLFWKSFGRSSEDISLFDEWPLIPAFLGRPILCRVRERQLVFIAPLEIDSVSGNGIMNLSATGSVPAQLSENQTVETDSIQLYISSLDVAKSRYPWLLSLLNQCHIPIFDTRFMECAASCNILPTSGQSLGQVIASKLVAAKHAGFIPELTSLSASDRDELFNLFSYDFSTHASQYGREELEVIRSLPIYRTVLGSFTRLNDREQCVISSNSFLKAHDEHCLSYSTESIDFSFLKALGVPELHDKEILVRFGLPQFEEKTLADQEDMLIYIYTNWQDLQTDSSLLEMLRKTKFVKTADEFSSDLSKPKDLFDPDDALLASVFSGERKRFPGERFKLDGWLRILRKVGLRTATDADVILECARKVESLGHECVKSTGDFDDFETDVTHGEISIEIWALAGSVVEAILSNFAVFYGNSFCNLLGKIACVPAEVGNVGGKKGGKRVLASYSEVILTKDWPLAWSCAPILSRTNVIPPEYSWGALHLRSPPPFATMLKHLEIIGNNGGEDTLSHWPTTPGMLTIDDASCEIMKYLDKIWGSISSSDMAKLKRVAFMPVANGTRLVTVNLLFARLTINLAPFAFELPTLYLPFVKILRDLGLQDTLSIVSAKGLLLNLQKACGYQRLNPNELRAVMQILYFVCDGGAEANVSDDFDWRLDAIVPDDGCRLVHAKSCVYIDSYGSRYVKRIDTSRLRFVHPDLPERICLVLGIQKLSDVVIEELDNEEDIETLEFIGSVQLSVIREKLLNRSFQSSVWTLLHNLSSFIPGIDNMSLDNVQRFLSFAADKLQFVKCLHTQFLLLPKSVDITFVSKDYAIPEWDAGSRHRILYFVNRSKSCILVAEPPPYISILDILATVVSQILMSPVPLPIGSLFFCPEGSEAAIADILKLSSDKREGETTSNNLIGKEIVPQDALQVQIHPLRPFYRGEIVAWRTQNGEKLKYGRVPDDVRPSAGQALYRFKVETALGVTEPLLSSQVFSFRTLSMGNEASSVTLPEIGNAAIDYSTNVDIPESSRRGSRNSSQQPIKELQYGRVSASELVQAVNEMLSTAGITMDIEKQSLLQKTVTLEEQLKESQTALLLEQEKADSAAKEAETAKAAWVCRVCLTNEVDMTIVPCGHVLCRRCSSAVSKCPFCRLQVNKTIKIFRP